MATQSYGTSKQRIGRTAPGRGIVGKQVANGNSKRYTPASKGKPPRR